MHRRLLIAVGAVLALGLLAGCSAAGSLQMTPVDDSALAKEASLSATDGGFSPGSSYRGRAGEIIENGSGTILAPDPPLETGRAYEYERQYYTFSSEVVEEVPGAATLVSIDYNAQNPNGTTIPFRDLSPADKRELQPLPHPRTLPAPGLSPSGPGRDSNRAPPADAGEGDRPALETAQPGRWRQWERESTDRILSLTSGRSVNPTSPWRDLGITILTQG